MKPIFQFLTLLSILLSNFAQAQNPKYTSPLIPASKLQADLEILQKNLEQVHAGLYTYTSKEEMDETFQKMKRAIVQPMSKIDFYRFVLPLHNKIRNGHTLIIPPASWSQAVEIKLPHFPFDIYEHQEKLYVLRNLSENETIQAGDEILEINGKNAIEVYQQLTDSWTKDGDNTTFPARIVSHDFSEFYAHVLGTPDVFTLKIKQGSQVKNHEVQGLLISEMRKISQERYKHDKRPWYNDVVSPPMSLKIQDEIATLTIPSFSIDVIKDSKVDYKDFFQATFQEIHDKNIQNLIIDIRGNGGGHGDVASEVFSYLHDQPVRLIRDIHAITKKIPNKKYYEGGQFFVQMQMNLALKKVNDKKFVPRPFAAKRNHLSLNDKMPSFPTFNGKLYVLVDGWSFSASGMFTSLLKTYNKGIFIGEEAGGNPHTQVGDFEQMLILPNSGTRIRIPLFFQEMEVNFENTRHGVIPEHLVKNTIEQELKKEDGVLLWTFDFIKESLE
ncbi:MAG: S41 family peptidase [Chitinophagales bacterium]